MAKNRTYRLVIHPELVYLLRPGRKPEPITDPPNGFLFRSSWSEIKLSRHEKISRRKLYEYLREQLVRVEG